MIRRNFLVNGVEFLHWFNTFFLPKYEYHFRGTYGKNMPAPKITDANAFRTLMANIREVSGREETSVEEFVAYFCLFYNETGAQFKPISEMGDDWYFFERGTGKTMRQYYGANLAWKGSYNGILGNEWAGDQLFAKGIIKTNEDRLRWNSQDAYPHEQSLEVRLAARDCDFYRFRGRGLIQTTGKDNYRLTVEPLLDDVCVADLSNAELDAQFQKPKVYLGAVRLFYWANEVRRAALARALYGDYDDIALVTAGNNHAYIQEFVIRTEALLRELKKCTLENMPLVDADLFRLNRAQVKQLQTALAKLNPTTAHLIEANGGIDGIAGKGTIAALQASGKTVAELISLS